MFCDALYVLGAMLCAVGFVSAVVVGMLDKYGVEQLGQSVTLRQDSKKLVIFNFVFFHLCIIACYMK